MARPFTRSFKFAAFGAPLLMVAVLSSCGDDDDAAPGTEVVVQPSSYITTPTTVAGATTTPGATAPAGEPGDTSPSEQTYVVQRGDFLSGIAADFDLTMDEIANFNNWADGAEHPLFPEDTIRIPPGALIPSPDDDEEADSTDTTEEDSGNSDDEDESDTTEAEEDPELCPDGERQGHYTIKDTDTTRVGVADRLNVTVEQLDEANANTPGYGGFFPGLEIQVPCGGDEDAADTTEA